MATLGGMLFCTTGKEKDSCHWLKSSRVDSSKLWNKDGSLRHWEIDPASVSRHTLYCLSAEWIGFLKYCHVAWETGRCSQMVCFLIK